MQEIKEYLESLLDDFNGNMIDLNKEMEELDLELKENTRFVKLLKDENDTPFSEFSPRDTIKNEDKIKELEDKIDQQTKEKENLQVYIDQVQEKIDELVLMIGKFEIYEIDHDTSDNNISNDNDLNDNRVVEYNSSEKDIFKNNIDTILSFLPADPMRAKVELQNLKNKL